jgi:hypothetical protein
MPPLTGVSDGRTGSGDDSTAEQILAAANSVELAGIDWLFPVTMEEYYMTDPINV